jgi:hypothetical protein
MAGDKRLENVNIVGLGPSWFKCPEEHGENEEIWGINTMYRNRKVDRIFIMHDLREDILLMDKDFIHNANQVGCPVYTAGDYPVFNNNLPDPVEKIIQEFKVCFFLNVICYMVAIAVLENVKKISLFGCDMRTDAGEEYRVNEKGAVEFWLGVAIGRGIEVVMPEESYLLKRMMTSSSYGYVPRQEPNGLVYMIPTNVRRDTRYYKLIPLDKAGNELREYAVTTQLKYEPLKILE